MLILFANVLLWVLLAWHLVAMKKSHRVDIFSTRLLITCLLLVCTPVMESQVAIGAMAIVTAGWAFLSLKAFVNLQTTTDD